MKQEYGSGVSMSGLLYLMLQIRMQTLSKETTNTVSKFDSDLSSLFQTVYDLLISNITKVIATSTGVVNWISGTWT